MYTINYSLDHNKSWGRYDFYFDSLFGAVFKARAICIQHWAATDVIDNNTGVVLVSFNRIGGCYIDEDLPEDIKKLASLPIE